MTKANVEKLRAELVKVLEKFNQTSDIKMKLGNASFGTDVTFKLIGESVVNGVTMSKEANDYKLYSKIHGLPEAALGYKFQYRNQTAFITGYSSRSPKYPVQYKMGNDRYKTTVAQMKRMLTQNAPEITL